MEGGEKVVRVCVAEDNHGKFIGLFLSEYYLRKVLHWKNVKITEFKSLEAARIFLWDKYEGSKFDLAKLKYNFFLFHEGYVPEKNTYWENIQVVCEKPIWTGVLWEV